MIYGVNYKRLSYWKCDTTLGTSYNHIQLSVSLRSVWGLYATIPFFSHKLYKIWDIISCCWLYVLSLSFFVKIYFAFESVCYFGVRLNFQSLLMFASVKGYFDSLKVSCLVVYLALFTLALKGPKWLLKEEKKKWAQYLLMNKILLSH